MRCKSAQFLLFVLISLIFSQTVTASNLIKVPESESYCANNGGFCFEWYLSKKPEIRFVDNGDEDGDVFMVYRKDVSGKYNELFQIYAALKDEQYPNTYFWGYAWNIEDIEIKDNAEELLFYATFDHSHISDNQHENPDEYLLKKPFILFTGKTTQPQMKIKILEFNTYDLDKIQNCFENQTC